MAKNRRGKNNRKGAAPALTDLSPATIKALAKEIAVQTHELQTVQPIASTDLAPAKETLPALVENRQKRSRPALIFLGLVEGGLKTVNGTLKFAQSTFCKDVENELVKDKLEGLLAVGITLGLHLVRPDKIIDNVLEGAFGAKMVAQPLGKLVITRLDSAIGWSRKKIEKYEAAIEAAKFKALPKPKDASFAEVPAPPEVTAAKSGLAPPAPDNLRMFPPPKPDLVEASATQVAKGKTPSIKTGSNG